MGRLITIRDTTLRDGHQSLWATRMSTEMMLPVAERLERAGVDSVDVMAHVITDAAVRFTKDDPFERMRILRKIMPTPTMAAYTASKAGVDSITRALAVGLAPYGVLVNSVAPGMMDTEMQRSTEVELARVAGRSGDLQAFLDERTRRVPLGRRAEIGEVAEAVVWLCLDAPKYMTAERLNMSGGLDKD